LAGGVNLTSVGKILRARRAHFEAKWGEDIGKGIKENGQSGVMLEAGTSIEPLKLRKSFNRSVPFAMFV
jgi:hypothetical protein